VRYLLGFLKSKFMYEYVPGRRRGMMSFYADLVNKRDLCFDLGSHLGNRAHVLTNLGCEVVAVEPHPFLANYLRKKFANNKHVIIEEVGLSDSEGEAKLYCSPNHLTVSSLNSKWVESLHKLRPHSIRFSEHYMIKTITINQLIQKYGLPKYCKIDIEGLDVAVLRTLSQPITIISFEHLPHLFEETVEAIDVLEGLADYRFNFFPRETHKFRFEKPVYKGDLIKSLHEIASLKCACDIYAFRHDDARDQDAASGIQRGH